MSIYQTSCKGNVEWRPTEDGLTPFLIKTGRKLDWAAQPGSQDAFLQTMLYEVLYEGTRGPGKTDGLLMDFCQHVGQGFGDKWRGILFRRTYPELRDVIDKANSWFPRFEPSAKYNASEHYWQWPTGEKLYFRHFMKEADYWSYHGHAYPWIGWEELTTWPDDKGYRKMMSTSRSTSPGIPRKYRATTNPYGVGHNWVKLRWRLPMPSGMVMGPIIKDSYDQDGELEPPRMAIHGELSENQILLQADPDYISRLRAAARNPAELRAWLYGDWNIVAGGMFDDVWNPRIHVLPNVPLSEFPREWRMDRSYDHGQSAPFACGWWAESNGEPFHYNGKVYGPVRGDAIRIAEWYGWNGKPNEGVRMSARNIALGIKEREEDWGLRGRVYTGVADDQIFTDYEPDKSVAGDMAREGIRWEKADKGPGSRVQGWQKMRDMFGAALPNDDGTRENPGLFVLERCDQFIRTVPVLPRDVDKDPDDVDTESEDHIGDDVRYRVRRRRRDVRTGKFR